MNKKMNWKGWVAVILFIAAILGSAYGLYDYFDHGVTVQNPGIALFFTVIISGVVVVGSLLFQAPKEMLINFINRHFVDKINDGNCRILVFGPPGSGKSEFVRVFTTINPLGVEKSTNDFSIRPTELTIEAEDHYSVLAHFADYCGQDPEKVIANPPEDFFGTSDNQLLNAVIFIADTFPAYQDDIRKTYDDEQVLEKVKKNTNAIIKKRVMKCSNYLDEWRIHGIIKKHSNSIHSVKLLINKRDLLNEAAKRNYIKISMFKTLPKEQSEEYLMGLYSDLIERISLICKRYSKIKFTYHIVSIKKDANLRDIIYDVAKEHKNRK